MAKKRRDFPEGSTRPSRAERFAARQVELGTNRRAFEGRADECDLVCLREIVPSATAKVKLKDPRFADADVVIGTVLPMTLPVMKRDDGRILLGLQTPQRSVDLAVDYGQALLAALELKDGEDLVVGQPGPDAPRLQDLLADEPLEIEVHSGFEWWLPEVPEEGSQAAGALAQANADVVPTQKLTSVAAAYWCQIGEKAHVRWARPDAEEPLLDALARLKAAGQLTLGEGSRFVGSFRALGLVVPVWDVPVDSSAETLDGPIAALEKLLDASLAAATPLTADERRHRMEIASRQLTLR